MENTKNDLSANEAKLDLTALTQTAGYAVSELLETISHYQMGIRNALDAKDYTAIYCDANWLKQAAERLAIATETYATLKGAETRAQITIIKPNERQ